MKVIPQNTERDKFMLAMWHEVTAHVTSKLSNRIFNLYTLFVDFRSTKPYCLVIFVAPNFYWSHGMCPSGVNWIRVSLL